MASQSWNEKRKCLLQELEQLQRQIEVVCKRIRELDAESSPQGAQPEDTPDTDIASVLDSHTANTFDSPTLSTSQTQKESGHHSDDGQDAPLYNSVDSETLAKASASSSHPPVEESTSTGRSSKTAGLQYYNNLDGDVVVESQLLRSVDLPNLCRLAATIDSDPERKGCIGRIHYAIFLKTNAMEDLERAIDRTKDQMPLKVEDPCFLFYLKDLTTMLMERYSCTGQLDDLQEAIFRAQEMVAATSIDNPDRSARLGDWITMIFMKCDRTGSPIDVDEAMLTLREAGVDVVVNMVEGEATGLEFRFSRTSRTIASRDVAQMSLFTVETDIISSLHEMDDEYLCSFAELHEDPTSDEQIELYIYACFLLFSRASAMEHLERAIQQAERWMIMTPDGHREQPRRSDIFTMLSARMDPEHDEQQADREGPLIAILDTAMNALDSIWNIDDLNRVIEAAKDLSVIGQSRRSRRVYALCALGSLLHRRFEQTGSMDDLNHAIEANSAAIKECYPHSANQAALSSGLGNKLTCRFEYTGSMLDLQQSFEVTQLALDMMPLDHKSRYKGLINLARCFAARFEWMGNMPDLNRAVEIAEQAVNSVPCYHPGRVLNLLNLGNFLGRRFECAGAINDINGAIKVTNLALDATTPVDRDRALILNNIGLFLGRRFERERRSEDLDQAVKFSNMAIKATHQDHPDTAKFLTNLGTWLARRYAQTGQSEDINESIRVTGKALAVTSRDHLDRGSRLSNLGAWLHERFKREAQTQDLDQAIEAAGMAVDITSHDKYRRAEFLNNLGNFLQERFMQKKALEDLERAISCFKEGLECPGTSPSIRISLGRQAGRLLYFQSKWEESSAFLRDCVQLLPAVSPRLLQHTDKEELLSKFAGLASDAAAAALNVGSSAYQALRLLELGRGVIAGLLLETRTDISDLQRQHPKLADEFSFLRDELDSSTNQAASHTSGGITLLQESRVKARREAENRFHNVIEEIRALPEFGNFLLPPTEEELKAAAKGGPIIVVNVSTYRCDAFLITQHCVEVLELPDLTLKEVQARVQDLQSSQSEVFSHINPTLEWLWDVLGRPILDALGFTEPISDDQWGRVWWIPTGVLSQLPLHAAGRHTRRSGETVLDRVMSSYVSSIKALIHGRRHPLDNPMRHQSDSALLVAMHETPGLLNRFLESARKEVEILKDLCPSLHLNPIQPILRKEDVLHKLGSCKIFHFAGHGHSDPVEPSKSYLLLEDWQSNPLTVGDLRDCKLQLHPPFLCSLLACWSGANQAERLQDEGIHLVSAFQLAGFRHVVGSLWEVSDAHCLDVARKLYETIRDRGMTDKAVCEGLHRALRKLRDGRVESEGMARNATMLLNVETATIDPMTYYWVPFVHFGV